MITLILFEGRITLIGWRLHRLLFGPMISILRWWHWFFVAASIFVIAMSREGMSGRAKKQSLYRPLKWCLLAEYKNQCLGVSLRAGLSTHTPAGLKRDGRYPLLSL